MDQPRKKAKAGEPRAWIKRVLESNSKKHKPWPFGRHSGGRCGVYWDAESSDKVDVQNYVCEQAHGRRPKGWILHKKCSVPLCCNKDHLGWRPNKALPRRAVFAKLTESQVQLIRGQLSRGNTYRSIARNFSVTDMTVKMIDRGYTWAWLPWPDGMKSPRHAPF